MKALETGKERMLCTIADLTVEVPQAGDMASRCTQYLCKTVKAADIVIREDKYNLARWDTDSHALSCYMESGYHFYCSLLQFGGMMLHASAVELDGKAYLFSGPCGAGKSTHTQLWQQTFETAEIFNDDKPALRCLEGRWYAYGTPWCGKNGINRNRKVPLAGICFLKQGRHNRIRRLDAREAVPMILSQTVSRFWHLENLDLLLGHVDGLVRMIPVYEMENRPEEAAVRLSYETMSQEAEL